MLQGVVAINPWEGSQPDPIPKVGSAPKHLIEAIRIELKKIVEAEDLEDRLDELGRVANQSCDLISCLKSPEAIMRHEHRILGGGGPITLPNNSETYGAQILRQIIPALQEYQRANKETLEAITEALAVARREGMVDVAAELEKKLLGKKLEGEKPIAVSPTAVIGEKELEDWQPRPAPVGFGG
jgi:hypothetical protein